MVDDLAAAAIAAGSFAAGTFLGSLHLPTPIVGQLGDFHFLDETALATQVMTVLDGSGNKYIPAFLRQGLELGGAHYIWAYDWPYNNPGEITVDAGLIADLWTRPNGLWALEVANFDFDNPKTVVFDDGEGHRATVPDLVTIAFLDLTQV